MIRRFARFKEMQAAGYFKDRMAERRAIQRGFPAPLRFGPNTNAYALDEVEAYVAALPRADKKAPKVLEARD